MNCLANTTALQQQTYQLGDRISDTLAAAAIEWLFGNRFNAQKVFMPIISIFGISILAVCLISKWIPNQQSGRYRIRTTVPASV